MEFKLELVVIPVSDVDRAKDFYTQTVGFKLEVDGMANEGGRIVQVTPPGSACSIGFGSGLVLETAPLVTAPPRPPACAGDGGDLCYVKDCGRAIALLMLAERLNYGIYNVSTGRLVRYSEVVDAINAAVPVASITLPDGRNPDRPPDNYLDTTRLPEDAGFRPEYDVERAVPDYVDWLRRPDR